MAYLGIQLLVTTTQKQLNDKTAKLEEINNELLVNANDTKAVNNKYELALADKLAACGSKDDPNYEVFEKKASAEKNEELAELSALEAELKSKQSDLQVDIKYLEKQKDNWAGQLKTGAQKAHTYGFQ